MSLLLALDPGLRATGAAIFEDNVLVRAGLVRSPIKSDRGPGAWRGMALVTAQWLGPHPPVFDVVVLEGQQVYLGRRDINPDNLIQLAGVCGAFSTAIEAKAYVSYLPRVWKRQVEQSNMAEIIDNQISAAELATYEPCAESLKHNISHAVGLGLFHIGRLVAPSR